MQLQQAPVRPEDPVIERFPSLASYLVLAWVTAALGLGLLVLATVVGVLAGPVLAGVLGGLVGAAVLWLGAYALYRHSLGPVLTGSQLLLPGALRGWNVVDLSHVTGVGLRFYWITGSTGARSSWGIHLWLDDDSRIAMSVGREASGPLSALDGDTEDHHVWRRLAETAQGRAALRIRHQVLAVQGPHGPLATQRQETQADPYREKDVAYWSPDGSMGRLG